MVDVVEYIVNCLVEDKDAVSITTTEDGELTIIHVNVAENDLGRVIGKSGRIANGIRAIVKSISSRDKKKCIVKFGE